MNKPVYYLSKEFVRHRQGENPHQFLQSASATMFRRPSVRKMLPVMIGGESCFARLHSGVGWGEILKNPIQLRMPVLGADTESKVSKVSKGSISLQDVSTNWKERPAQFSVKMQPIDQLVKTGRTLHDNGFVHRHYFYFMKTYSASNPRGCLREDGLCRQRVVCRVTQMAERDAVKRAQRAPEHAA